MGNEQSSLRLTEEERDFYRKKGYDDFAKKCRPIKQDANDAEVQKASERAETEKASAKVKADQEAAQRKAADDRERQRVEQDAAEAEAAEAARRAAKEEVEEATRKAWRNFSLSLDVRRPSPPRKDDRKDSHNTSSNDDTLSQWGDRKERRPVDPSLEKPNSSLKSTDEDALFVPTSRQPSTNRTNQALTVDTTSKALQGRTRTAHDLGLESSRRAAATPVSAKQSLANNRPSSCSNSAMPASASASGAKRPLSIKDLSSLGPIAKRQRTTMSTSASPQSPSQNGAGEGLPQPEWYTKLKLSGLAKGEGDADSKLKEARHYIKKAKECVTYDQCPVYFFNKLREVLHTLTFTEVNEKLLRNNRMLHNDDGLPQVFDKRYDGGVNWPEDMKADAEELDQKWRRRDFDTDMMRGINFTMAGQQGGDSIKPEAKRDAKRAGNNGLVNGQWWPTLVCAVRDGAHGATVAGIAGDRDKDKGAYSCFISGGGEHAYPDIDEGEIVKYCGTDATNGEISAGTQLMLASMQNGIPVRFIRSSKARGKSNYAPPLGFRYDGLYDVKDCEILDHKLRRHRFTLVRRPGQAPIRGGEGVEARPTKQERDEYLKHKRLAGGK